MPLYECNEHQFVETSGGCWSRKKGSLSNRPRYPPRQRRYGPATMPDQEFKRYETICTRKSVNSTVYAKVPLSTASHGWSVTYEEDNLHAARVAVP